MADSKRHTESEPVAAESAGLSSPAVPEDPASGAGPGESEPTGDRDPTGDLERLRELLLGAERRDLAELRRRFDDWELTPEEVAEQLPEAIGLRTSQDEKLARALGPTLEAGIAKSVERNPQQIAQAIYPILGPAIRRAISEALSGFVERLNRAIEHSLSWRGIKWRFEALRAGVPFAEVVLKHALIYRIEEAFLIESRSGLPIGHVALDEARTENPDLISGMLTAIQDFVADSFATSREAGLSRFKVGELTVRVESGPRATLAAVVRGEEPGHLVERMQGVLETIHLQFRPQLAAFDGDPAPLEPAEPILAELLETVVTSDRPQSRGVAPRIAWGVLVVALLFLGVLWARSWVRWSDAVAALRAEPGLTLLEAERGLSEWRFEGLRDPLAREPAQVLAGMGVDPSNVAGSWESYLSFDPEMVLARAEHVLHPPDDVELVLDGEMLRVTGAASARWAVGVAERAAVLAGVSAVDLSGLEIRVPEDLTAEGEEIEGSRVLFDVGSARAGADALRLLDDIAPRLIALGEAAGQIRCKVRIRLIGRTDSSGTEEGNKTLSEQRATSVRDALTQRGVAPDMLSIVGIGVTDPLSGADEDERRRINRSVSFDVGIEGPFDGPSGGIESPGSGAS